MKKISLTLVSAVLLLAACSRPAVPEEPIRAVKVMTVGVNSFTSGYEFAGEVRAKVESRLGFRVGGKIIKRQAELGQRVKAGQVLAQLDPQDYNLASDAAKAQLQAAATNRDLAAADYKRYKELKDQNFISGAELERRETTLKAAQAPFQQAQAQWAVQGNQASYTVLVADVAGVVTAVEADPGQVVTAGTPVVRIAADGPRDVVFSVPEDMVMAIKPGMPVEVREWTSKSTQAAKVREVAASADPATRTFQVKVSLDVMDQSPPLGSTMYVLPKGLSGAGLAGLQVIKLPTSALRQEGKASAVWILDQANMTVKTQIVQIATVDGNEAVIAAGLQPGMLVISAGVHVLSAGQKVSIYKENTASAHVNATQSAINKEANETTAGSAGIARQLAASAARPVASAAVSATAR